MAEEKKKPKKKAVKKAVKKVAKPAKKGGGQPGNENARLWSDEDLEKLCEEIKETSKNCYSYAGIAVKLEMSPGCLDQLARRHKVVRRCLDQASAIIANKAWIHGFEGKGFPNILQKALNYHDNPARKREIEEENEKIKAQENIKADIRIREKKELASQVQDGHGSVLDEFDEFLKWKALKNKS